MRVVFGAAVVVTAVWTAAAPAAAQDPQAAQLELAQRYAPVLFVRPQHAPCDTNGEPFEPAPVEIVLDNPEVFLRQAGNNDPVAMRGPSGADIFDLREGWYLDFPGDALEPGCIFEQDFHRFYDGQSVMYAHVIADADQPGYVALQYWFFWYYNPAKNNHEGDWEFVQLLFKADTVEQALTVEPTAVGYAQHTGGERSGWNDSKLEKIGERPVVYPAQGSHASYYDQALFLGRSGREGFGCDNTEGSTRRLDPTVVLLPDEVSDPNSAMAWLTFKGRWGQRESGFFNGPTGPIAKERWAEPVAWQSGLRNSSVAIPGGDRPGDNVVNTFCRTVEVGSSALMFALRSPVVALGLGAILMILSVVLASRTRWSPVVTAPIRERRAMGQIVRAAVRVWRDHPLAMVWVGLVYVPVALVTSFVQAVIQALPLADHVIDLAGDHSGLAFLFAVFVGGLGNLLAFVYVSTVVARTMERGGWDGGGLIGVDGATLARSISAALRGAVIVIALMASIIGIPWALRQLVRYQVAAQVVALEDAPPGRALRRSSQLVQGHWWWTAGVVALVQIVIAIAGIGSALVILITVTAIPLWLFSVLSSVIYVVLVPVAAAAMTYVYGALASEERRDDDVPSESEGGPRLLSIE